MGLRDTLKEIIKGIQEKQAEEEIIKGIQEKQAEEEITDDIVNAEVAKIEAAEDGEWRKELEVSVGGDNKGKKPALKEKVKQTENVKTNNSPKETKKGQPGRNEDREIGD